MRLRVIFAKIRVIVGVGVKFGYRGGRIAFVVLFVPHDVVKASRSRSSSGINSSSTTIQIGFSRRLVLSIAKVLVTDDVLGRHCGSRVGAGVLLVIVLLGGRRRRRRGRRDGRLVVWTTLQTHTVLFWIPFSSLFFQERLFSHAVMVTTVTVIIDVATILFFLLKSERKRGKKGTRHALGTIFLCFFLNFWMFGLVLTNCELSSHKLVDVRRVCSHGQSCTAFRLETYVDATAARRIGHDYLYIEGSLSLLLLLSIMLMMLHAVVVWQQLRPCQGI